jgi:hypothetical protein
MTEPLISHAIQLAIAPVFLLTGIAGLLSVMANRLARVVDRTRYVQRTWRELDQNAHELARAELAHLERRRHLASWSINFCTAGALLVCLVIVTLFVDDLSSTDLRWVAGGLFICTMAVLIGGLACFLREVYLATESIGIEIARFEQTHPEGVRKKSP